MCTVKQWIGKCKQQKFKTWFSLALFGSLLCLKFTWCSLVEACVAVQASPVVLFP